MALKDQPYLPLYIQDIMTNIKLNECSAATHGIYIKGIMCLMHKSDTYGKILLKQNYKQTESISRNFALQLVKHLPYSIDEIEQAISELLKEKVCYIEGEFLCQKRMIKDNAISDERSKAGKKGGGNPNLVKTKVKTNDKTNAEYEYINENKNIIEKEKVSAEEKLKQREEQFRKDVYAVTGYLLPMLHDFCRYWTEPNKSKTKMRFELQKVFDISRRLATWAKNDKTFNKQSISDQGKKEFIQ